MSPPLASLTLTSPLDVRSFTGPVALFTAISPLLVCTSTVPTSVSVRLPLDVPPVTGRPAGTLTT